MQVIIDQVLSSVNAVDGDKVLSEKSMRKIVETVMQAIDARGNREQRVDEEHSLENYQRRELG